MSDGPQTDEGPAREARPGPLRLGVGLLARSPRAAGRGLARGVRSVGRGARWLWERRPPGPRAIAMIFALALAAAGVAGLSFVAGLRHRLPAPLDWEALSILLDREARPGDALTTSPAWAERARLAAPARVAVLTGRGRVTEPLPGVRRVWLVSLPDAPGFGWAAEEALLRRGARTEPPVTLGGLELSRFRLGNPDLPLAFVPDGLAGATALLGDAPCPTAAPLRCPTPGGGAIEVRRTVRELEGGPRPCLLVSGPTRGPLSLTFPSVPLGRELHGHVGRIGAPSPGAAPGPIRIAARVGDEELGSAELAGGGWPSFRLDTSRLAGQPRDLTLVIDAPTAVCLDALSLP